jgi:hypothetical protein
MSSEDTQPDLEPRRGMPDPRLSREQFRERYLRQFVDPAFDRLRAQIDDVVEVAWQAYSAAARRRARARPGPNSPIPTTTCRSTGSTCAPRSRRRSADMTTRPRCRASSS